MYPNHQGKYDLLGIITTHDKVLSFVMDKQKSHTMLVREFVDLVQAKRLEKDNPRQGLTIINEVAKDVKTDKRYVLFPVGWRISSIIRIKCRILKQEALRLH